MSAKTAALAAPATALRGVVVMAIAMGLFVTNDTFLKLSMRELPLGEALAVRSAMSAVILAVLAARAGELGALAFAFQPRVLVRSGLDTFTTFLYIAALAVMPIASSTTIYMVAPLLTTALAVPLLGEKVGWRSWCAILVGFVGAVVVTRPDPATFSIFAAFPMVAAMSSAVRDIGTRSIGREVPGSVIGISATIVLTLTGTLFALWEPWRVPSLLAIAQIVAASLAFAAGTLALVFAFRTAPVASLSPMRYLLVPGALTSSIFVFGDLPDAWTSIGMVLVVGAGLYALKAEHAKSRVARARMVGGSAAAALGKAVPCAPPND